VSSPRTGCSILITSALSVANRAAVSYRSGWAIENRIDVNILLLLLLTPDLPKFECSMAASVKLIQSASNLQKVFTGVFVSFNVVFPTYPSQDSGHVKNLDPL